MGANLDPFDVEALEKSLNDSAVRVSTIWVTFLVFGLYLVIAAGSVTTEQLFLSNPIKLPVLNVDLPLVGFFSVAPALFVIFHSYVLIQVVLLSRTASVYNEAVERSVMVASDRARIRQRLANTLFAQVFAGSPHEREGLLGILLRLMVRVTLAIGPVLVLLLYQVTFLPYQNLFVTFTHRVLIAVDLVMVLVLWRGILKPQRVIGWRVPAQQVALAAAISFVFLFSVSEYFPGEPHAKWMPTSWMWPHDDECGDASNSPYRLYLPHVDVVDDERLTKIERETKIKGLRPHEGERTRNFSDRNLRCGNFYRADLRRADFTYADLRGANLAYAQLQGAVLTGANLEGADLQGAQLQGADLSWRRSREGYQPSKQAFKIQIGRGTQLSGALLANAQLQGARLVGAEMRGSFLRGAQMQGTNVTSAELQGADLRGARMQAADLRRADLRGADLSGPQMQAANLAEAHLEGARFDESSLTLAQLKDAYLWRAMRANCHDALVIEPRLDLTERRQETPLQKRAVDEPAATPDEKAKFIENVVSGLPKPEQQQVRERLVADAEHDDATDTWRACEKDALTQGDYERKHADYLVEFACKPTYDHMYLIYGIYGNWIEEPDELLLMSSGLSRSHRKAVIRGLLGPDGKGCLGAKELGQRMVERLADLAHAELGEK